MPTAIFIKATGKAARQMALEYLSISKDRCTRANGSTISSMEKELKLGIRDKSDIPAHSSRARRPAEESLSLMAATMLEILSTVNLMAKENITLQILARCMRVTFRIITCTEVESWSGPINPGTMASLEKAKWKDMALNNLQRVIDTLECLRTTSSMEQAFGIALKIRQRDKESGSMENE